MKKTLIYCISILAVLTTQTLSAQPFRTKSFTDRIKTLRVFKANQWNSVPVIDLNKDEQVEINFDLMGASPEYYTYTLIHCDADWNPSQLVESEYLDGLQNTSVDDYANSFNTKMDYVNYKLLIPNDNIRLKVSGNYVVQIIPEDHSEPVVNACFSVVEPQTFIQMQVSPVTDKGSNSIFQAVSFEVNYNNEIKSPSQELKVFVEQNNRWDNTAQLLKPLTLQNKKAIYDHNPALIFDAGNEYRRFEMTTTRYVGMNIASVEYYEPYYHSILNPDRIRSDRAYFFYEDINGRMFVRNNEASDSDIEADYQVVHFYIPCNQPFAENVYILSEAFNNLLDSRSKMEYSEREKGYVKAVLLKEGYYNYLFVTRKMAAGPASTAGIEGNYYQTENEYRVWVYARTAGMRYDKLIGVQSIQFKP
ncbi:MAG: hypothetical protein EZS26_002166 [Candidatus Ordinivivax streblomastigis]|uniref:Type 9 secretion system plug protein N-terminal domain-containing protein n=1 Tax=Candidatus Ordinivivax streblomastigis TaxID=2540710 RepID=A0A5M8NZX9_9BACT|nr:MAG: hypothetical protein EZS26_002166 [Candidatus Ordinivivax streblomastigis]